MEIKAEKNTVLCRQGDLEVGLYYILTGKVMVCSRSQKMVTPIAYLGENEYFGEFSFFDKKERSADVIAIEDITYLKIPEAHLHQFFPPWLLEMSKQIAFKIRHYDEIIRNNGIKRTQDQQIKPLSFEEQKVYYDLLAATE